MAPMLASLAERTRRYLTDEMAIAVHAVHDSDGHADALSLAQMTAVIGIGGPSGLLIAFSYSPELADALFQRMIAALEIPPHEAEAFRGASLTEILNVIAGNWIADFSPPGARVCLTPPVLVEGARHIHRVPNATFRTLLATTEFGPLNVHLIGPQNLFDLHLNAA